VGRLARRFVLIRQIALAGELPADERDAVLDLAVLCAPKRR
jgi:hypothetical protein